MISLEKRAKPQILVDKETEWTNQLMEYSNSGQKVPDNLKAKYRHQEIKEALLIETHNKCAYCESKITHIDYGDIEHIIPKSKKPEKTFLWDNLTIGCSKCNNNKKDYFDEEMPLLNPYLDNPEEKIAFIGPFPIASTGCQSTQFTIKKLKLNRPELIERRLELVSKIEPLISQYNQASNPHLKRLILDDLINLTNPGNEFSLMIKQTLNNLSIIA